MSGRAEDGNGEADGPDAVHDAGPRVRVAKDVLRPLPKRFYKVAGVAAAEGGYAIVLDGRPVKTPGKRAFVVASLPLAEAIAAEWAGQGAEINPGTMPLTRIANSAIDAVAARMEEVRADIVAYAGSDLVCYRADAPPGLLAAQAKAWDPVLTWARETLGARFVLAQGVMPVAQSREALAAVAAALAGHDALRLAALHVVTTLTGSALIALAHAAGALSLNEAWSAAHVDEDWQISQWGEDAEASERRAKRLADMAAAALILALR